MGVDDDNDKDDHNNNNNSSSNNNNKYKQSLYALMRQIKKIYTKRFFRSLKDT